MLSTRGADCARTPGSHDSLEPRCQPSYNSVSPATGRTVLTDSHPFSPTVKAAGSLNSPVTSLAFDLISNLAVELSPGLKTPRRCLLDTLEAAKSVHRPQEVSNMDIDRLTVNEGESRTRMFSTGSEDGYEPMEDVKNDEDATSPLGRFMPAPSLRQTTLTFGPVEQELVEKNPTRPCIVNSRLKRNMATLKPPSQSVGIASRNPFTKETARLTSHWSQRRNNGQPLIKDNAPKFKSQTQTIFGGQPFGTPTPSDFRSRNSSRGEENNISMDRPTLLRGSSSGRQEVSKGSEKEDGNKDENENSSVYSGSPYMAPPSKFRRTQSASSELFSTSAREKQHVGVRHCNSVPVGGAPSTADSTILPCIETGRDAIKRISPKTLIDLLNGQYNDQYDEHYVIDCRFPYEFEGGHIKSAVNINSMDGLENLLIRDPIVGKKMIIVFHCEFSSQRAPRMALHLRNQDRQLNVHNYPNLTYPEVYILNGGYKDFFAEYKEHCLPQRYVEMANEAYKEECKTSMTRYKRSFKRSKSYTEGYGPSGNLSMTTKTTSSTVFSSSSSFCSSAATSGQKSAPPVFGPFTFSNINGNRSSMVSSIASAKLTSSSSGSQISYLSSFSSSEETIMECTQDTLE